MPQKRKARPSLTQLKRLAQRYRELRPPTRTQKRLADLKELKPLRRPPLSEVYPEIAQDWLDELNLGYSPDDFNHYSSFIVWWICPNGPDHVFEQKIRYHVREFEQDIPLRGCPFCRGHLPSVTNNLQRFPHVAREWDEKRNKRPVELVVAGTNESAWFICSKNKEHKWKTRVCHRTGAEASGCPYCQNRAVAKDNTIKARYPDVAREFHPTKNKGLSAASVVASGTEPIWWQCANNKKHVWQAQVYLRTVRGAGCPRCAKERAQKRKYMLESRPPQRFHAIAAMVPAIVALVEDGFTYKEVAAQKKISVTTVVKIMRHARGRQQKRANNDKEERAEVLKLLKQGFTFAETAEKLGISYYKVSFWAKSKVERAARQLKKKK